VNALDSHTPWGKDHRDLGTKENPARNADKEMGTCVNGDLTKDRDFITAVLATCGALVVVFDVEGRFVYANRALERVLGYSLDELKGQIFFDVVVSRDNRERSRQRLENGFCASAKSVLQPLAASLSVIATNHYVEKYLSFEFVEGVA